MRLEAEPKELAVKFGMPYVHACSLLKFLAGKGLAGKVEVKKKPGMRGVPPTLWWVETDVKLNLLGLEAKPEPSGREVALSIVEMLNSKYPSLDIKL